jgi:hypothetical protein
MQHALLPFSTPLIKHGLRFAITLVLIAAFIAAIRLQVLRYLLPVYLWEISSLDADFHIIGLGVQQVVADTYISVNAALAHPVTGAGKILYPDSGFELTAATLSGYVLQTIILFAGILCAWPSSQWRSGLARIVLGPPVLLAVLMIDVPLVLLSALRQGVLSELGDTRFHPLLVWANFLNFGGRLGLAVFAGIATVLVAEWLSRPRTTNG